MLVVGVLVAAVRQQLLPVLAECIAQLLVVAAVEIVECVECPRIHNRHNTHNLDYSAVDD